MFVLSIVLLEKLDDAETGGVEGSVNEGQPETGVDARTLALASMSHISGNRPSAESWKVPVYGSIGC
jgi:hypothetical protein